MVFRRYSRGWVAAIVGSVLLGATAGGMLAPRATSQTFNPSTLGLYSYGEGCNENNRKDPVGIMFTHNEPIPWLDMIDHFNVHGTYGTSYGPEKQHFRVNGVCHKQTSENATGIALGDRDHIRWYVSSAYIPWYGHFVISTPHHDELEDHPLRVIASKIGIGDACAHAIRARSVVNGVVLDEGGFQQGKVAVGREWHNWNLPRRDGKLAPHRLIRTEYWGNDATMGQCSGAQAGGDGNVDIVDYGPRTE